MSEILDSLIFNRVQADIDAMSPKAYMAYDDLNRVETAVQWVSYVLNCYGYGNVTNNKTNWQMSDFRTEADMIRLRKNVEAIRAAYYTPSNTPLTPARITYTSIYQANAIEQIIYDIGNLIEKSFPGPQHLGFKLGTRALGNRSISL